MTILYFPTHNLDKPQNIKDLFSNNLNIDDVSCLECFRVLPNEKMFTKNGCVWCDTKYHRSIKEK